MSRSRRWTKNTTARKAARAFLHSSSASKMDSNSDEKTDYSAWSQEKLIQRVTQLETELKARNKRLTPPAPLKLENRILMELQLNIFP
jgi:hypothetical protein